MACQCPEISDVGRPSGSRESPRFEPALFVVSIVVSIDPGKARYLTPGIPADRAGRQRVTDLVSDSRRLGGRLISVRSGVQLYPGPSQFNLRSRFALRRQAGLLFGGMAGLGCRIVGSNWS